MSEDRIFGGIPLKINRYALNPRRSPWRLREEIKETEAKLAKLKADLESESEADV